MVEAQEHIHSAVPRLLASLNALQPPYSFRILNLSFKVRTEVELKAALNIADDMELKVQYTRENRPAGRALARGPSLASAQALIACHGRQVNGRPIWIEVIEVPKQKIRYRHPVEETKKEQPPSLQDLDPSILEISAKKLPINISPPPGYPQKRTEDGWEEQKSRSHKHTRGKT